MSSLRLMTYNLRVPGVQDDEPDWTARRDDVASMIRFHAPTVLGVQEALPRMLDDLEERLPSYTWVGRARDDENGEHCALFYRPDHLTLERHGTFWLSTTPDRPRSRSWGAAFPRIATWAVVTDRPADIPVTIANTHFDHESSAARRESARTLHTQLDAIAPSPGAVVMGDLNAPPETPPYQELLQAGFRDALYDTARPHHGPTATFNGFDDAVQPGARIDYIFVRGPLPIRRHGTLTDRWDGTFPSDHCPVLAEVALA